MTILGILFDKDGTLLDYDATWMPVNRLVADAVARGDAALAARLLMAAGHDEAAGRVRPGSLLAAGTTAEVAEAWAALAPDHGRGDLTAFIDGLFQRAGGEAAVAVPGMEATLTRLQARGLALGVATNDSHQGALETLAPFGVVELFDFIAGYDSGHGAKPGPGMVHAFGAATGLAAAEVCVVGDSLHDLEMGRTAGAGLVVAVLTGTGTRADLTATADLVIDSIVGLEALIGR